MRTNVPNIFAIGDIVGQPMLAHKATHEAKVAAEVIAGEPSAFDARAIPAVVYTDPQIAYCGLTEEEARDIEPVDIYCSSFKPMNHSFAGRTDRVLMKLVVSKATRKVLGCHIVADHAGEMIQLVGIAVKMGATKEDFDRTVAVHPTMAEELVTMKEPVRSA
mgnify:CR=1 FL=1